LAEHLIRVVSVSREHLRWVLRAAGWSVWRSAGLYDLATGRIFYQIRTKVYVVSGQFTELSVL
jgi:hypothetical protein